MIKHLTFDADAHNLEKLQKYRVILNLCLYLSMQIILVNMFPVSFAIVVGEEGGTLN